MRLFADSSGWIALFADADKYHQQAAEAFHALQGQRVHFLTSDYVLDEALTYLKKKYGHTIALKCGHSVLKAAHTKVIYVDEEIWDSAWTMFQAYDDKAWAFTDCTSFVLMQRYNLWRSFTFDHHFAQMGFQLWPSLM